MKVDAVVFVVISETRNRSVKYYRSIATTTAITTMTITHLQPLQFTSHMYQSSQSAFHMTPAMITRKKFRLA